MMTPHDPIRRIAEGPAAFEGHGINHEGEAFTGRLDATPLVGGAAVLLRYVATLGDGSVAHEESALLGRREDGLLCLWPVMSELPAVLPHVERPAGGAADASTTVLGFGRRDDTSAFREEITLAFGRDGTLTFAHAWGLPGGEFADRSACTMRPRAT